jgi:hypothetical protein
MVLHVYRPVYRSMGNETETERKKERVKEVK